VNRDLLRAPLLRLLGRMVGLVVPAARIGGSAPNRILLIRPDHLGDLLLTGPAIAALRATLPAARLTLLVGPWSLEAARRSVEVDEVRTLAFPGFTRRPKRHALEPYLLLAHEARELRGIFDTALVLRPDHWWGALLALLAGVPRRIGYATPLCAPLLTQALPLPNGAHAVELSLRLVRALAPSTASDPASQLAPRFEVRTEERAWAAERLGGDRWVLIHPGSGAAVKDWPAARWAGVADALAERGWQIALSGG
jgi:ADP-heptose:LPS heptosyltransferase